MTLANCVPASGGMEETMPFPIVSFDFAAYQHLEPGPYKLMHALARRGNGDGEARPLYRQLAADIGRSVATVSRWMAALHEAGCFTRRRMAGGGRYLYIIAEAYRLRLPNVKKRFPQRARQQVSTSNNYQNNVGGEAGAHVDDRDNWPARIRWWREKRAWMPFWGPKPNEAGCWAPPEFL
jgi:Helix-turn-helix domain